MSAFNPHRRALRKSRANARTALKALGEGAQVFEHGTPLTAGQVRERLAALTARQRAMRPE